MLTQLYWKIRMKDHISTLMPARVYLELKHYMFMLTKFRQYRSLQKKRLVVTKDSYSYKPFDDSQSIFIHIPKCAGVAINKTLYGNLAGGHITLNQYVNIFKPKELMDYFKFTIVRNPWDRIVSAYHFLEAGGFGPEDKQWFDKELRQFKDFNDFVLNWVNHENIQKWHHFRPQYHYMLEDNNKVELDFLGFVENIDNDFQYITQRLGVTSKITKSNNSKHKSYIEYYNNQTKDIIADIYEKDIDMLGYDFDNSNLKTQINNRNSKYNCMIELDL